MKNNENKPSYNEAAKIFDIVNTYLYKLCDNVWGWDGAIKYIQEHWNDEEFNVDYKDHINTIKAQEGELYNTEGVTISTDELKYLKACKTSLYAYQNVIGLCPNCEKSMLCYGYICPHCGYDNSYSVKEWKQMHENKN